MTKFFCKSILFKKSFDKKKVVLKEIVSNTFLVHKREKFARVFLSIGLHSIYVLEKSRSDD